MFYFYFLVIFNVEEGQNTLIFINPNALNLKYCCSIVDVDRMYLSNRLIMWVCNIIVLN